MKGGKQPGAGRPKGSFSGSTLKAMKARELLIEEVTKKWKPLIEAQMALALGHYERVKVNGKTEKVYLQGPDQNAIKYLMDQTIGRAKESLELSGEVKTLSDVISELNKN